jgi:hypothetical protein
LLLSSNIIFVDGIATALTPHQPRSDEVKLPPSQLLEDRGRAVRLHQRTKVTVKHDSIMGGGCFFTA